MIQIDKLSPEQQIEIKKIDRDAEQILTQLKNNKDLIVQDQQIREFIEQNLKISQQLIKYLEFKNCYYIYKRLEKVLIQLLKYSEQYHQDWFPISNILSNLTEHPQDLQKIDLKPILLNQIELQGFNYPKGQKQIYELIDYLFKQLVICINNGGVIYMMRNKTQVALSNLLRAMYGRFQFQNDYKCIYQLGITMINCAFCFKNLEKYEEAGQLINKGILTFEYLEKIMQQNGGALKGIAEKSTHMLALVEFLFNQNNQLFDEITENENEKVIYSLSISYKYYAEVMIKQKKNKESDFCMDQSKQLYKQFQKSQQRAQKLQSVSESEDKLHKSSAQKSILKLQPQTGPFKLKKQDMPGMPPKLTQNFLSQNFPANKNKNQENKQNENFSNASFHTVNTNTTLGVGQSFVSKDNILFQKYLNVNEIRYKIVIVQIKEFNCVQLLLYNKPINFLKKIIIGFNTLVEYSRLTKQDAFKDQTTLQNFFKDITRKIQVENDDLQLREIEFFNSVEQFINAKKQPVNYDLKQ